ncbi:MAG: glycoside hydrolase [Pseudonocardiaceae bacterium]|nr:glycoside hydrolase [Pseudonocardiaceae bacterium]
MTAVAALVTLVPADAALADPPVADDAPEAVQQLSELNHEAEVLTEKWHRAKDQLDARRAEFDRARADAAAAAAAGEQARAVQARFRGQVDRLAKASFQGARLNKLSALLVSRSPEQFLDKMSALDALATDNREALDRLATAVEQAEQARRVAEDAAARAARAEQQAASLEAELDNARADMQDQIAVVEQRLAELTADERESYSSGGQSDLPISVPGSGAAAEALRAALEQQGDPYSWGADGPDSFDCSGLVYWAYQQAGVELPRSSSEQAATGTSVSRSQLQPGDLIALYSPVSHIGVYVGDGRYVHAPQPGDVVEVTDVPWEDVTAMRRVG